MAKAGKLAMQAAEETRREGVGCLCGCHLLGVREEGQRGDCPPTELNGGSGTRAGLGAGSVGGDDLGHPGGPAGSRLCFTPARPPVDVLLATGRARSAQ